jgi:hypothetical protein
MLTSNLEILIKNIKTSNFCIKSIRELEKHMVRGKN